MEDREYTEVDDEPTTMMYEESGKARGNALASAEEDDGPTIVEIEQLYTKPVWVLAGGPVLSCPVLESAMLRSD
jgi:hypothetical protein